MTVPDGNLHRWKCPDFQQGISRLTGDFQALSKKMET